MTIQFMPAANLFLPQRTAPDTRIGEQRRTQRPRPHALHQPPRRAAVTGTDHAVRVHQRNITVHQHHVAGQRACAMCSPAREKTFVAMQTVQALKQNLHLESGRTLLDALRQRTSIAQPGLMATGRRRQRAPQIIERDFFQGQRKFSFAPLSQIKP